MEKIELEYPLELKNGDIVETVSLRRPTIKELRVIKNPEQPTFDEMLRMAQACSDLDPPIFDRIDVVDSLKIVEVIGGFFTSGRTTGAA